MFDSQEYRNGGRLVTLIVENLFINSTLVVLLGIPTFKLIALATRMNYQRWKNRHLKVFNFIFIPP